MKYIVIGGNAAGMSAASRLKRKQPAAEVVVFEQTGEVSYGACGMPYYIAGFNASLDLMRIRRPEEFRTQGIDLRLHTAVERLDVANQCVAWKAADGTGGMERYDKLVIATGASPIMPPVRNAQLAGVYTLKTLQDAERIKAHTLEAATKTVAIVGGGYIGLELAEAFLRQHKRVLLFESMPNLLNTFDPAFGEAVAAELKSAGVEVFAGQRVTALEGADRVERIVTDCGAFATDAVIFAVGVRPNTAFLSDPAFEKLPNGALVVNDYMQTSVPEVYAAGDCATVMHKLTGRAAYLPLGTNANKQGRFAADAILGVETLGFRTLGTSMLRCVNLELARTGLTEREALAANMDAASITVQAASHARYYPTPVPITIKVCYQRGTGAILGVQLMGHGESAWRIDVFACAIDQGMRAAELGRLDLGYAPPFASVWDAVHIAANAIKP